MPARTQRAFTLVEMLVVIAIIGILAALLFPALSGARAKSLEVDCASNLGQLGKALYGYASTYGGAFPLATADSFAGRQDNLISAINEYIPSNAPAWFCKRYTTYHNIAPANSMATNGIGYFYWAFSTAYPSGLDMNARSNAWLAQGFPSAVLTTNAGVVSSNSLPLVLMSDRFPSPVTLQYHRGRDYTATDADKGTHTLVSGGAVRKIALTK